MLYKILRTTAAALLIACPAFAQGQAPDNPTGVHAGDFGQAVSGPASQEGDVFGHTVAGWGKDGVADDVVHAEQANHGIPADPDPPEGNPNE